MAEVDLKTRMNMSCLSHNLVVSKKTVSCCVLMCLKFVCLFDLFAIFLHTYNNSSKWFANSIRVLPARPWEKFHRTKAVCVFFFSTGRRKDWQKKQGDPEKQGRYFGHSMPQLIFWGLL